MEYMVVGRTTAPKAPGPSLDVIGLEQDAEQREEDSLVESH